MKYTNLKNYAKLFHYYLVIMLITLSLCNCSNYENDVDRPEDMISFLTEYSVTMTGSWMTVNNEFSCDAEISTNFDLDFWELEIENIEFYLDDYFITSISQPPYSIEYSGLAISKGSHKFIAYIYFKDLKSGKQYVVTKCIDLGL